jgi:hypothetical protein
VKGTINELPWLRPLLQPLYEMRRFRLLGYALYRLLTPVAGHQIRLVFERRDGR